MFLHSLFMQDPKNPQPRKPWYQRVMEAAYLWKPKAKTSKMSPKENRPRLLRRCSSLHVASSFTRACLCAPVSSYNEIFQAELPPRRNKTYPRSKSVAMNQTATTATTVDLERSVVTGRRSVEGRRVFRGKSLTEDLVMRRFVVDEAMMQAKRRNQMDFMRRRRNSKRKKLGPSPLSRMVMASEEDQLSFTN